MSDGRSALAQSERSTWVQQKYACRHKPEAHTISPPKQCIRRSACRASFGADPAMSDEPMTLSYWYYYTILLMHSTRARARTPPVLQRVHGQARRATDSPLSQDSFAILSNFAARPALGELCSAWRSAHCSVLRRNADGRSKRTAGYRPYYYGSAPVRLSAAEC